MSIALDFYTGNHPLSTSNAQMEKLLAWVGSIDAKTVHVTLRGAPRQPEQKVLQRTLLGMGCRITLSK